MRRYTDGHIVAGDINTADHWNADLQPSIEVLNGGIDMHSLPLGSITEGKITNNVVVVAGDVTSATGAFNAYYTLASRTDVLTYDPAIVSYFSAWNSIEDDFNITFEAKEGMVIGSVVVTGSKLADVYNAAPIEVATNGAWELRIFCNDVEIATSGYITCGVYTIDLPFSTPVGNGSISIVPQFRLINLIDPVLIWDYPLFSIEDRFIWLRNCYR